MCFVMLPTIDATVRADVNGVLSQPVTVQAGGPGQAGILHQPFIVYPPPRTTSRCSAD